MIKKIWSRVEADIKEYRFAIAGLFVYWLAARLLFHAFCPMVILTGLPCPGCGLSRALWFLLTGQLHRSFALHPLGIFWLLLVFGFAVNRYVAGRSVSQGFVICLAIVCIATLLFYIYRMAFLFPGRPPISYTGRNVLERLVPGYRRRILSFFGLYR